MPGRHPRRRVPQVAATRPSGPHGRRAIKILGYSTKKITRTDPETGDEVEDRLVRYPVRSVFDISQTDGDPSRPASTTYLAVTDRTVRSTGCAVGSSPTAGHCARFHWLADARDTPTTPNESSPPTRASAAARLVVLLHEAAHAILHGELAPGEYQAHRGVCETEAESTAYVLANLLGLDVDASSISYVAGWSSADPAVLSAAAAHVLRAVNTIADGLGLDVDEEGATDRDTAA